MGNMQFVGCLLPTRFLVFQWFEIIFQFSHSVYFVLKDFVFLLSVESVENRLALWWVLPLALALSDPAMCQPVCVSYSFIIFLNSKVSPFSSFIR